MRLGIMSRGGGCPGPTAVTRAAVDLAAVARSGPVMSLRGSSIRPGGLDVVRERPRPMAPEYCEAGRACSR
jgi:hypothetical protein